ncbi:MAG: hypothetical protein RMY16_29850 [Nostoc sp. DedQUE12b]|uniref:hypothetical protein n=1 Tax=Nostoc sp. DedQUE12b TaxID=3075398 RepID=UPI002AD23570|nr:hypothetical protein [Nostoc sp. DedQUE12b]MDZ8089724.1 hypothetical protein [Nostoc sp. DedQUE12b]
MFQPLSTPLQGGVRFFFHPLPSREFGLCCLGLTKIIRPLLDPVGLTLLYRLVVYSLLDAVFSAVDIMFTQLLEARPTNPSTPLLGRACQPDLALW